MKYDFAFKKNRVELYKSGQWPETPNGIGQKNFRKRIVGWAKIAELHRIDDIAYLFKKTRKEITFETFSKVISFYLSFL